MLCMYRPTVCETSLCVAGRRSMDAATGDISLTIDYLSFAFNHLVHQFVSLSGNWRRFLLLRSRMVLRVRQWVTYHVVSRHARVLFAASRSCVQQRVAWVAMMIMMTIDREAKKHCQLLLHLMPSAASVDLFASIYMPTLTISTRQPVVFTARCTLVQSAVLRSHVVCLSVCLSVCL